MTYGWALSAESISVAADWSLKVRAAVLCAPSISARVVNWSSVASVSENKSFATKAVQASANAVQLVITMIQVNLRFNGKSRNESILFFLLLGEGQLQKLGADLDSRVLHRVQSH